MSDYESMREDAKRERHEEKLESVLPEPCGCEMLSVCCESRPHEASPDVDRKHIVGLCGRCRDNTIFEPSQEQTWVQISSEIYGDDADGNRGVLMKTFECTECKEELEVIYE